MVISGTLPPIRGLFLFPAQLLAAISAAAVVQVMTPGDIGATNTTLSPGTSIAQGVFIEMFMTAELVFVVGLGWRYLCRCWEVSLCSLLCCVCAEVMLFVFHVVLV
jgi:glycerol uptake facilitator-like aquaporin